MVDEKIVEFADQLATFGVGTRVIAKCIYNQFGVRVSHTTVSKWVKSRREKDKHKEKKKLTINDDVPREKITHVLDFYRLSNGSIRRKHHSRKNLKWGDLGILLGAIRNLKTNRVIWEIWSDTRETTVKTMTLIQKALDEGEEIRYLQVDRVQRFIIEGCEKLGITVVCYGKTRDHPYNTYAEQVFSNLSKALYENLELIERLPYEYALQFFRAMVKTYLEYDGSELAKFQIPERLEEITLPSLSLR